VRREPFGFAFLTPGGCRTVVHYQMTIRRERLVKVRNRVVGGRGKGEVDVGEQRIPSLPAELFPQKLDHSLKSVGCSDLVEVLPHDWCISDGLESYYDFRDILLLVGLDCVECLGDAI